MFETTLNLLQDSFIRTVQEEVKPALDYTEPISLALVAAVASSRLDGAVKRINAWVSPNLMKNDMGATVPGIGMIGLPAVAALDALGGNARAGSEVLKDTSSQVIANARVMLSAGRVAVVPQEPCEGTLLFRTKVYSVEGWACVAIVGDHTSTVHVETNKDVVSTTEQSVQREEQEPPPTVLSHISLEEILAFVNAVPFKSIRFILDAVKLSGALFQERLCGNWGPHIGTTFEKQCVRGLLANDFSTSVLTRASAASDAQMGGATLPAMNNLGSGNQGITATAPVMMMAEHSGADKEKLTRALILSHLSAIYIHRRLPHLSALRATTTAVMGTAVGMAWTVGGHYDIITMAISSMIDDVSGIICDGASNSCAMRVSTSASAVWKAVLVTLDDTAVAGNEGIVAYNVEQSIANLCALACRSMQETDRQIAEITTSKAH